MLMKYREERALVRTMNLRTQVLLGRTDAADIATTLFNHGFTPWGHPLGWQQLSHSENALLSAEQRIQRTHTTARYRARKSRLRYWANRESSKATKEGSAHV
jgi:hypothetical protein